MATDVVVDVVSAAEVVVVIAVVIVEVIAVVIVVAVAAVVKEANAPSALPQQLLNDRFDFQR